MIKRIIFLGLVILFGLIVFLSQGLRREYKKNVKQGFERNIQNDEGILTLNDIQHLPKPVQNYLLYVGAIGKEKVRNFKAVADAEMQMNQAGWEKSRFEQYNFFGSHLTRLFYLNIRMFGIIPVIALHSYTDEKAGMLVKLGGLIPVADVKGKEMRISDTVTLLNDMCIFAPASLIEKRIQWEFIDDHTVKAIFRTNYCTVSARLYFNDKGELINFISGDRYAVEGDTPYKRCPWSTPLSDYREINGVKLASYGEVIWHFPEGDNCYLKMTQLRSIQYNCNKF